MLGRKMISFQATRWSLFVALAMFIPAPILFVGAGFMPPLATLVDSVGMLVSSRENSGLRSVFLHMLLTIAFVAPYLWLTWMFAGALARYSHKLPHRAVTRTAAVLVASTALGFLPIFGTSVHGAIPYTSAFTMYARLLHAYFVL